MSVCCFLYRRNWALLREFVTLVVSLHNREETLCIGAIFVFTLLFKCKTNTFNGPLEKNILCLFVIKSPLKSCPISVLSLRQIRFSTGYITLTQWTEYPFIHCQNLFVVLQTNHFLPWKWSPQSSSAGRL